MEDGRAVHRGAGKRGWRRWVEVDCAVQVDMCYRPVEKNIREGTQERGGVGGESPTLR